MPRPDRRWCFAGLAALLAVLGCGDDVTHVHVGQIGESLVAAVIGDETFVAYRCGDLDTLADDTAWFAGGVVDGELEGAGFTATLRGESLDARVPLREGGEVPVTLARTPEDDAGLFSDIDADGCRTALVIRRAPGAGEFASRGAHFCAEDGVFSQVTPVSVGDVLGDTLEVEVALPGGPERRTLIRAVATTP